MRLNDFIAILQEHSSPIKYININDEELEITDIYHDESGDLCVSIKDFHSKYDEVDEWFKSAYCSAICKCEEDAIDTLHSEILRILK